MVIVERGCRYTYLYNICIYNIPTATLESKKKKKNIRRAYIGIHNAHIPT